MAKSCSIVENGVACDRPHKGHGFCDMHHQRWKKHGDPLTVKPGGFPKNSPDVEAKRCSKCGEDKLLEEFAICRRYNDGRTADCRVCRRSRDLARIELEPEQRNKWARENRERYLAYARDYNQRTKAQQRPGKLRYEQRKRLGFSHDAFAYAQILRGDPCSYCGVRPAEIDHIEPIGIGPRDDPMNLTAACHSCNSGKRQKPLLAWLIKRKEPNAIG